MENKRSNLGAEARNYEWEIRIGGPTRGEIFTLRGRVFKNTEAVESALASMDYLCTQLGLERDFMRRVLKDRIRRMKF